ncbi:3-keto-disaccharide hydrolase [Adhaeretor mobilis]|uniref:3-keto-alpha-glucoside-1,2-lyase/3-keto-2-hydroxy-glucal hydratase domain-containing protein n=1 Tax=Adhaeretor mobilis TaxID=1930276 RepID=A0A517MPE5_9BACT|nr:DUF1080 domain-containing protein [Adhaeretor mobilis]QDS96756.1 hypothetical protein HG15A2_00140 [Adhaeretor mobilis]
MIKPNPYRSSFRVACWACAVGLTSAVFALAFTPVVEAKEPAASKTQAKSLFNGKNLKGWVKRGGDATYAIEGDAIVGTSVPNTQNTFLCTELTYGDFMLEVDFKVDDGLNSGIQIRSNVFDEVRTIEVTNQEGKKHKKKIPANRVHGYQVEIDTSERSWSAGIYDEARRGWLNQLDGPKNKAAREAFKHNEWNHYKIVCQGGSIKTWINGVPAADLKDNLTARGFIALQVHNIPNKELAGKKIRWKNIMLTDLSKGDGSE